MKTAPRHARDEVPSSPLRGRASDGVVAAIDSVSRDDAEAEELCDDDGARHHGEGTAEDMHPPLIGTEEPDEEGGREDGETDGEPETARNPSALPGAQLRLLSGFRLSIV